MTAVMVDQFDLQLLAELQHGGHATNSAPGEKIHLSTSQVGRRILRLQEGRVIDHYCAIIDPVAVCPDRGAAEPFRALRICLAATAEPAKRYR